MLKVFFYEINYLLPLIINFLFFFFFFFKLNTNFSKSAKIFDKTIFKQAKIEKKPIFILFYLFFYLIGFWFLFYGFFSCLDQTYWWGHFYFSEENINFFLFTLFFTGIFFKILYFYFIYYNFYLYEYIFCIKNISIFMPFFFFINNFFFFFIYLELISIFIFFLFIISKIWNTKNFSNWTKINFLHLKNLNISYINLLFFQFWSSFFSSIFIAFSLLFFINKFCSVEWGLLNYLNLFSLLLNNNTNSTGTVVILVCLIFAVFIKLGFTPIHFFKLEIYKGLSFLSIFLYTTFFFFFFLLLVLFFFLFYFYSFLLSWFFILIIIITFSLFFSCYLLFDLNYLKFFFAYSSILNCLVFLLCILNMLI